MHLDQRLYQQPPLTKEEIETIERDTETRIQLEELAVRRGIRVSGLLKMYLSALEVADGLPPRPELVAPPQAEPKQASAGGYVYIIKCRGLYKIGRAVDFVKRIAVMTLPEKPRVIATAHCADYGFVEKAMHALFAHKRKHGEWFDLDEQEVMQARDYLKRREVAAGE